MVYKSFYHQRGSKRGSIKKKALTHRRRQRPERVVPLRTTLGLDRKYVDFQRTALALSNAWAGAECDTAAAQCLNACVQGSGENNREGTKICVKSLSVNGYVTRDQLSDQTDMRDGSSVTVAIVRDIQTNGAQLNAEDVYLDTAPLCPPRRVMANTSRFKVLARKDFNIQDIAAMTDGANTASLSGACYNFSFHVKLNDQVNFVSGAGAGTVADIKDVSYHIIACSTHASATDRISWNSRVRFYG